MRRSLVLSLAFLVVAVGAAYAAPDQPQPRRHSMPGMHGPGGPGGPGGPPEFRKHLFPPELILHNQLALDLTEEQLTAIKKSLYETQSRVIDLKADLARVTERLNGVLEPSRVDESAALAAAEDAMRLESRVKQEHLALLIRVKNLLTEEQQETLRDMRPHRSGN